MKNSTWLGRGIALTGVAALAFSVAACGNGDGDNGAAGGSGDGDLVTVGFVAVGPEGAWRQANEENVQSTFSSDAGFDLRYSPSQGGDQNSQIQAFTDFVDQGVDIILLSATEGSGWEDSLRRAQEAEIPVVLIDRGIEPDDTSLYETRIAPDNVDVSTSVAEWAISEFPDGGTYFVLEGPAGVSVVNERNEGWKATISGHDEFIDGGAQTANWSTDEARSVFETVLRSSGNGIDFVFAQNDEMGLGAAQAVSEAGLVPGEDVKIATIDGSRAALEALVDGRLSFVAEYNPLVGQTALDAVNTILDGGTVDSYLIVPSTTFDDPEATEAALPDRDF
ncbi:substrate-binding domain-containing protein [Microbacterium amylolyticum]|uniref:Simple sugar transport system substrate-binding protein n=1 Tax=Microbacterium amylolyticum TaxID=936337 RepID=A0ABS4ZGA3_9MICO|nr:substrate-binding domain-containing protein [Microbacterium amylolyticum]MBP2436312.1 simple sugar transport system substrate-binding protein [Microbacterium amylolyticum]